MATQINTVMSGVSGAGLQATITSPEIAANMWRRGIRVMTKARENLNGPPRRIDTGRLRSSINIGESQTVRGGVRVGTDVEYAVFVHDGTQFMEGNPFLTDALSEVPE